MTRTSEFVSLGHPDKVADYISSRLLDEFLKKDPNTRFAVEVQVKDNFVSLAGEITSTADISNHEIRETVREAVREIGYTHEYALTWGADNVMDADNLSIYIHIGTQSPDIAQGVDRNGWGDQGIFWGMATIENDDYMPEDHNVASRIGRKLYEEARRGIGFGLDIKTQVTEKDGKIVEVIAAVPCRDAQSEAVVRDWLTRQYVGANIIVNGTGRYVRHSSVGDCGTTGRKLAVDFYGGNCRIGGGSPWTKDGSKADVALNMLARKLALYYLQTHRFNATVYCAISCCIGRPEIRVTYFDDSLREIHSAVEIAGVEQVVEELGLRKPVFAELCRNGLFSRIK